MLPPGESQYADGIGKQTDRRTDGRQTVTLRFLLDEKEVTGEGIGESEMEEPVSEWGWP